MIMHVTLDWNLENLNIIRIFLLQSCNLKGLLCHCSTTSFCQVCVEVQVPLAPVIHGGGGAPLCCWGGKWSGPSPGLSWQDPGWEGHRALSTAPHLFHGRQIGNRLWVLSDEESPEALPGLLWCHREQGNGSPYRLPNSAWGGVGSLSCRRKWVWRAVHDYPMGWKCQLLLPLSDAPWAGGTRTGATRAGDTMRV